MTIGPAGEKLSPIAIIANDHRAAARTGMGAVMGSKKLKAITVRGTLGYPMADKDGFKQLMKKLNQTVKNAPAREALHKFGTDGGMMAFHDFGDVPVKNWTKGAWTEGAEKVSGPAMAETILTDTYACRSCMVGCGRVVEVKEGVYAMYGAGPEYETSAAFGPLLMNDNLEVVANYNLAPTQEILVIVRYDKKNHLENYHWGFVPFWSKDTAIGHRMINARSETVATKPSFRTAFKKRRCLILHMHVMAQE